MSISKKVSSDKNLRTVESYDDIKPSFEATWLSIEKVFIHIFLLINVYFTNLIRDETSFLNTLHELGIEHFQYELNDLQLWLIIYYLWFTVMMLLLMCGNFVFEIIYRIKPKWW